MRLPRRNIKKARIEIIPMIGPDFLSACVFHDLNFVHVATAACQSICPKPPQDSNHRAKVQH